MTSLTGWPTETPHAATLLAESPVLHLLGCISHRRSDPGRRVASQVPRALSPPPSPPLSTHHYRCHDYHQKKGPRLCLRAPSLRLGSKSRAAFSTGVGLLLQSVANSVPFYESAPLLHGCVLPSLGGIRPSSLFMTTYYDSPASSQSASLRLMRQSPSAVVHSRPLS